MRQFTAASQRMDQRSPDLFEQKETIERRKTHLALVVRRLARKLGVPEPVNLDDLDEGQLEEIRVALSKQVAQSRRAPLEQSA